MCVWSCQISSSASVSWDLFLVSGPRRVRAGWKHKRCCSKRHHHQPSTCPKWPLGARARGVVGEGWRRGLFQLCGSEPYPPTNAPPMSEHPDLTLGLDTEEGLRERGRTFAYQRAVRRHQELEDRALLPCAHRPHRVRSAQCSASRTERAALTGDLEAASRGERDLAKTAGCTGSRSLRELRTSGAAPSGVERSPRGVLWHANEQASPPPSN